MIHDIESNPAPVTDHLTIERRLSRLEANQQTILDTQAMHGAAIAEIVGKLMAQGLWIAGPEPTGEREKVTR